MARKDVDGIIIGIPKILRSSRSSESQIITDTHIRSTFVGTPIEQLPSKVHLAGRLELAIELAKSGLAGDDEDYAGGLGNILEKHVTNLILDVFGLVANGNLRYSGQVYKCGCEDTGRHDEQVDGLWRNARVTSRFDLRVTDNLEWI